jgi:hypothetical protein
MHPPEFRVRKKDAFMTVPNLKSGTVRKYVAQAGRLSFVQTVKTKGDIYLQLTQEGQRAIAATLARWIEGFGEIHHKYSYDF